MSVTAAKVGRAGAPGSRNKVSATAVTKASHRTKSVAVSANRACVAKLWRIQVDVIWFIDRFLLFVASRLVVTKYSGSCLSGSERHDKFGHDTAAGFVAPAAMTIEILFVIETEVGPQFAVGVA